MFVQSTKQFRQIIPLKVAALKTICNYPLDATVHEDSWGLKKLFTYGCRKAKFQKRGAGTNAKTTSPVRRDTWLYNKSMVSRNQIYQVHDAILAWLLYYFVFLP